MPDGIEDPVHTFIAVRTCLLSKIADHHLGGPSRFRRVDFVGTSHKTADVCATLPGPETNVPMAPMANIKGSLSDIVNLSELPITRPNSRKISLSLEIE
jgi:hypothetical protein